MSIGAINSYGQDTFKRDLKQVSFVPKGQWIAGLTANYSQSKQDNYQLLFIEDITGDTYSYKITPLACYSFADNMAAGLKIGYKRGLTRLESASLVFDPETSLSVENLYMLSHGMTATGVFRNYISLGTQKRFGLYNEVQLEFDFGQSKVASAPDGVVTGAFEESYTMGLALAPGMVMFLNNDLAFEVNVVVLGLYYTHTNQINDQIYVSQRDMTSLNFKTNLLSISFGIAFYL